MANTLFSSVKFYLYAILLGVAIPAVVDVTGHYTQRLFMPTLRDLVQELTIFPSHDKRPLCCCAPTPELEETTTTDADRQPDRVNDNDKPTHVEMREVDV